MTFLVQVRENGKNMDSRLTKFYRTNTEYFRAMTKTHDRTYYDSMLRLMVECRINIRNKKIIDIGCGSGTWAKVLRNTFGDSFKAYGIDISELGNAGKYLRFRRANAEKIPYKSGIFDIVFISDVLEHVIEPKRVLKEAVRVLKKNGLLIIRTPNFLSPFAFSFNPMNILKNTYRYYFGTANNLSNVYRLKPILSKKDVGGDKDAVSGITFNGLLGELDDLDLTVIARESWAGGPNNLSLIRILNRIPILEILGASATVVARK